MNTDCVNFHNWILNALPLQKYLYYTGSHMSDSILSNELRKVAWEHACKGKIYLVQEKVQANIFRYIAIKASSPPIKYLIPLSEPRTQTNPNLRRFFNRKPVLNPVGAYNG